LEAIVSHSVPLWITTQLNSWASHWKINEFHLGKPLGWEMYCVSDAIKKTYWHTFWPHEKTGNIFTTRGLGSCFLYLTEKMVIVFVPCCCSLNILHGKSLKIATSSHVHHNILKDLEKIDHGGHGFLGCKNSWPDHLEHQSNIDEWISPEENGMVSNEDLVLVLEAEDDDDTTSGAG
jgi:hypothetical protein